MKNIIFKNFNKLTSCLLLLGLTSCLKIEKNSSPQSNAQANAQVTSQKDLTSNNTSSVRLEDLLIQYIPREKGVYDVHVSWPQSSDQVVLMQNELPVYDQRQNQQPQFSFSKLKTLFKFDLKVLIYNSEQKVKEAGYISIEVPEDKIISADLYLTQDTDWKLGRLFLENNARIYAQNFNLKLQAYELIAEGDNAILAFPDQARAGVDQAGRSAGQFDFLFSKASGKLVFNLNAEGGGHGKNGYRGQRCLGRIARDVCEPTSSCHGHSGQNSGQNGTLNLVILNSDNFIYEIVNDPVAGGSAGLHGDNHNYDTDMRWNDGSCETPPHYGQSSQMGVVCSKIGAHNLEQCNTSIQ